jgi:hypothetical protein
MGISAIIDDKAKIPLFAALATIPVLAMFSFWMTAQYVNAAHVEKKVVQLEVRQDKQIEILSQIRDDVLIIKEKLKNQESNK